MRPRVFPAEDILGAGGAFTFSPSGFNEAAGIPRGRPASADIQDGILALQ